MRLFDVHQFELPEKEVIDWEKTKGEIESTLSSYLVSRERMGLTRMPPIHSTYSLLDQIYQKSNTLTLFKKISSSNKSFFIFTTCFLWV